MDTETARRLLTEERERLGGVRAASTDDGGAFTEPEEAATSELSGGIDQHPADVGTELFERERDLAIMERVDAELADVDAALARLDQGTYGTCEACGRAIPDARLEALPATRFCVDDQALAEREARAFTTEDNPRLAAAVASRGDADTTTDAALASGPGPRGNLDFGVPDEAEADDLPDDATALDPSTADATGVAPEGVGLGLPDDASDR